MKNLNSHIHITTAYTQTTRKPDARNSQAINNKRAARNLKLLLTNAIGKEWADVNNMRQYTSTKESRNHVSWLIREL